MSQSLTFLLYYNQGYGSEDSSGKKKKNNNTQTKVPDTLELGVALLL